MNRTLSTIGAVFGSTNLLLVDSAVKGAAVLVSAAVLARVLRRDSAAIRHHVWLLAIIATLFVPVLSVKLPHWRAIPGWVDLSSRPDVMETSQAVAARPDDVAVVLPRIPVLREFERPSATLSQPHSVLPDSRSSLVTPGGTS